MNKSNKYNRLLEVLDSNIREEFRFDADSLVNSLIKSDFVLDGWITERSMPQEGKAYFIPDQMLYKAIALLRMIMAGQISLDELSDKSRAKLQNLIPYLRQGIEKVKTAPEVLSLGEKTIKDADKYLSSLVNLLEEKNFDYRNRKLVEEPISESKVTDFRLMIEKQWQESRILSKIFEFYDAVVYNPPEKLKCVGLHKIQFKGAKVMFVESNYQEIFGIEWGYRVTKEVTRLFLQRLQENKNVVQTELPNYLDSFEQIVKHSPEINVALISIRNSHKVLRSIAESGHFADYRNANNSNLNVTSLGTYKENLAIFVLNEREMLNGVIAFKLPGSILMKRRTNEQWIDGKLQLDIKEITDHNVKEVLLNSNPNADLSNPHVLAEAKTGILIELDETIDFEVAEPSNIVIIRVESA